MTREFASWADPRHTSRSRPVSLHNPFQGFAKDVRLVGRNWRWGRGALSPGDVDRLAAQQRRTALPVPVRASLRDPFVAYARAALAVAARANDQVIDLLSEAGRWRPELAVRAGADPLFRTLLADPARRAALAGSTAGANS